MIKNDGDDDGNAFVNGGEKRRIKMVVAHKEKGETGNKSKKDKQPKPNAEM